MALCSVDGCCYAFFSIEISIWTRLSERSESIVVVCPHTGQVIKSNNSRIGTGNFLFSPVKINRHLHHALIDTSSTVI